MFFNYSIKRYCVSSLIGLFAFSNIGNACTSLIYKDANGFSYGGRTMELPMELPYEVSYFPVGHQFKSRVKNHSDLSYVSTQAFIAVTVPDPITKDLKVAEGVNEAGLSFSLLAFAGSDGPRDMVDKTKSILSAIDLGAWSLSNFRTVAEVKAQLKKQPVEITALLPFKMMKTPFHYTLHDSTGASIVIEYFNGRQNVIDNPIGVMTNGPEFQWHLTNLNNYTFLTNKDQSKLELRGVKLQQPDSGIATVALPSSNTSVGRFVRAVYYSNFTEKAKNPNDALVALSHIMNNFDRPRGVTIDERLSSGIENMAAPGLNGNEMYISEYTSWIALSDLSQRKFYLRPYGKINYVEFDLMKIKMAKVKKSIKLSQFVDGISNGSLSFQ